MVGNLWELAEQVLTQAKLFLEDDKWKILDETSLWTVHFEAACTSGDLIGSTEVYPYERMLHSEIALPVELNGCSTRDLLPFVNEVNRQASGGTFFVDNRTVFLRRTLFYANQVPSQESIESHFVLLMDTAAYFAEFLNHCLSKPGAQLDEIISQLADQNDLFPGHN